MRPVYKRIKVLVEHCPTCLQALLGNNSAYRPWTCQCGTWKVKSIGNGPTEYEIIPHAK